MSSPAYFSSALQVAIFWRMMMNFFRLIAGTALLASVCGISHAADFYVGTVKADDKYATSSPAAPFATIKKAVDLAGPGDTVYLRGGTYGSFTVSNSGSENQPITIKPYANEAVTIQLEIDKLWAVVLRGAYITIEGLTIRGNNDSLNIADAVKDVELVNNSLPYNSVTNPLKKPKSDVKFNSSGIVGIDSRNNQFDPDPDKRGYSHHITIRNNVVSKFGCAGIGVSGDYIVVENNKVFDNAWYSGLGCSGISHFATRNHGSDTVRNFSNYNTYPGVTGYRSRFVGNLMWNNKAYLKTYKMNKYGDGNGLIIDADSVKTVSNPEGGNYIGRILIANNVSVFNGGSGMHVYKQNHVDIINNTAYKNVTYAGITQVSGTADIYGGFADDVRIFNNIVQTRTGGRVGRVSKTSVAPIRFYDVKYGCNLYYDGVVRTAYSQLNRGFTNIGSANRYAVGDATVVAGQEDILGVALFNGQAALDALVDPKLDPSLVDQTKVDPRDPKFAVAEPLWARFRINGNSPAINRSCLPEIANRLTTDVVGVTRALGAGQDLGAFEYNVQPDFTLPASATYKRGQAVNIQLYPSHYVTSVQLVGANNLPAGLSLDTVASRIVGTVAASASLGVNPVVSVRATNGAGSVTKSITFTITP
jgi:hypothetical protein